MIIVRIWLGLGNQMFQYAYAKALQEKGISVRLDLAKAYDEVFPKYINNDSRENIIQNFRISIPEINVKTYGKYEYIYRNTIIKKIIFWLSQHSLWRYKFYEEERAGYSKKSAKIRRGEYYIKGWFQNEDYFKHIRAVLLREFVPQKKIRIPKDLRMSINDSESVSIHVRRKDYIRINHSINAAYYRKAIDYMKGIYRNPIFVVFSDDLEWVKKNMQINGRHIYVNEERNLQDYEELFIMSRCKSNIIANSTFSWWAAWLNQNKNKIVIAPRIWMESQGDIVPKEWIKM